MRERTHRGGGGGGGGGRWRLTMATLLFCLLTMTSRAEGDSQGTEQSGEMTCDRDAPATYTAAVVEYSPELGVTEENIGQRFKENINAYKEFINAAKKENVDIIVFPECGLATLELPRLGDGSPAVSVDISHIGTNPCIEKDIFHQQEMRDLSCAARDAGMYVVVNLPEHESCSPALAFCHECPGFDRDSVGGVVPCNTKGLRYFNTDVAFDRKGNVIARYRKFNLFGEPGFVAPSKADLTTFMTDFGVRFGIFTCFDLMFETPAVQLVAEAGVTDLIFPTAWFSELPFLTAIQAQAAWSWVLDVNMLAAGYNLPAVGSTGSGLFAGRRGVVAATMERARTSKLLVGKLPNARSCKKDDANVTLSGHTVTLKAYESRGGSKERTFLGVHVPTKMPASKKAMELPKRKVAIPSLYKCHLKSMLQLERGRHIVRTDTGEATYDETHNEDPQKVRLLYKRSNGIEGEDDQEILADEAEFKEALAPRLDGTSKLLQGERYRSYLKDLIMSRVRSKQSRLNGGSAAEYKHERVIINPEEYSPEGEESNDKSFKRRRESLDDIIFGKRRLQTKSEKKQDESDANDSEPSIEEIALTMLSGLEEGGDKGKQLREMVEKLKEDQEKSKLASKPQPSMDEVEDTLLGAMRELSGNMTAETDILDDVMMDLAESDQREAAERKLILERCQRILMELGEQDIGEENEEDADDDSDTGLPVLTMVESKDDSEPVPVDSDLKSDNEVGEVPGEPVHDVNIPEVEGDVDKKVFEGQSTAETEGPEEPEPTEEELRYENLVPGKSDVVGEEAEDTQEDDREGEVEDVCDDETCNPAELGGNESESESPVESSPSEDAGKTVTSPDVGRKTPLTDSECSNYVKTETIEASSLEPSDAFLYLKTEDLQKYSSLLLTSQSIIENSTVTVCHGIFCCYFSVTIHPSDLPGHTGVTSTKPGESVFKGNPYLVSLVEDEDGYYAQKLPEVRNLIGLDNLGHYGVSYIEEGGDEDDDNEGEEKVEGDKDELADIDLSEMVPDEYDDDDSDIVASDIHEGPVFLQTSVLQTLQAGEPVGAGAISQEDMEPSEHIIEEEKKVKERERKAISEGYKDELTPSIPEEENREEEEGGGGGGDQTEAEGQNVCEGEEQVEKDVDGSEEMEPPTEDREVEAEGIEEVTTEDEEPSPEEAVEEGEVRGDDQDSVQLDGEIQQQKPKDMEDVSKSVCDCVDCWEGKDEALPERDEESKERDAVEEGMKPVGQTGRPQRPKQDKGASKRYYYRLVVYNGLRTFDGITDGGLQVCAVVSCTGASIDTCGKLHSDADEVIPTKFEQVSIRGSFRRSHALPMPTTLGMDMMPLPARSISLKEIPVGDEGVSELTMAINEETEFVTFGIYSRDFIQDPPRVRKV